MYDEDFHPDDFLKHCQEGAFRAEICAMWGISLGALAGWVEKFPKMREAYEKGKAAQQGWYFRKARRAAFSPAANNNGTLIIFLGKNMAGLGDQPKTDFEDVGDSELDFQWTRNEKGA